jgi:REP element-mobilizing transposase RayT
MRLYACALRTRRVRGESGLRILRDQIQTQEGELSASIPQHVPMERKPQQSRLRLHRQSAPALITACTANREPLLRATCAEIVLDSLRWLDAQRRLILYAAVAMPDHVHFVADPLGAAWASHLHALKSHSGRCINRHLGRSGEVWQRQYHDRQVRSDDDLIAAIKYCALNPVRAGLILETERYPFFWERFG